MSGTTVDRASGKAEELSKRRATSVAAKENSVAKRIADLFGVTIACSVGIFWVLPRALPFLLSHLKALNIFYFAGEICANSLNCYDDPRLANFLQATLWVGMLVSSYFAHPVAPFCIVLCRILLSKSGIMNYVTHPRRLLEEIMPILAAGLVCFNSAEIFTLLSLTLGLFFLFRVIEATKDGKIFSKGMQKDLEITIALALLLFYCKGNLSSGLHPREWVQQLVEKLHLSTLPLHEWVQQSQNFLGNLSFDVHPSEWLQYLKNLISNPA